MKLNVTTNNINLEIQLTSEQIQEVINFHSKSNPIENIKSKISTYTDIKTFEDVLIYLGKDVNKKYSKFKKIRLIYKVFQKISNFIPDYSNSNQYKWYPHFVYDRQLTKFVFYTSNYAITNTNSYRGVRFCLPNKEVSDYVGKQFINEFNDILL